MGPLSDAFARKPTINWGTYDYNPPMHSGMNNNNYSNSNTKHNIFTNTSKLSKNAYMGSSNGCNFYDVSKWDGNYDKIYF